jgi:PilZ domain
MINTVESTIADSTEARPLERRRNPRYPFIADVQVLVPNSGIAVPGRTADLSSGGCYVDTINPLPPDTLVKVRLSKWDRSFEAQAKVVYSAVGMGMGLMFVAVDLEQRQTMESWMGELGRQ